jgi:hypothetical protein
MTTVFTVIPSAVRKAAVHSLGQLAANRPLFAGSALDHLADMFNDEIEQVTFYWGVG